MSDFNFDDVISGMPSMLAEGGINLIGQIVRGGGLGGMVDMFIPPDIAKNNPQIAGLVKQFVTPMLKRLNDEFVDLITGTGGMDVPMSVFANSRGYAYNLYNRQHTLRSTDLRDRQKAAGNLGYYNAGDEAKRLFGAAFADVLGYTDAGSSSLIEDNSVIGSIIENLGSTQLKEFQGIGRGIYANILNDDAARFGGELDKATGRLKFDDTSKNLAAYGATDLSKRLINSFYGVDGERKFGSLSISDVDALTDVAQSRTRAQDFIVTDARGKVDTNASQAHLEDYNKRIAATVERLAVGVDNVRDVLGRQVSAGDALKFLSQMSGSNVANMGSAAIAALSSDFRDVGIRNDMDAKEFAELAKTGTAYYSRFGINQGIGYRMELDRLKSWGSGESQVVGYSDEDKVADERRLMANREMYGLSENVRTAYAAYIGQTNGEISQKSFDDFIKKVGGVDRLRSTEDISKVLSKMLNRTVSTDDVERASTTTTARVIGRTIDTNSAAMKQFAEGVSTDATSIAKELTKDSDYQLLSPENLNKLGVKSTDELLGLSYAELSDRFASAKNLPQGMRAQVEALRATTYRRIGIDRGISPEQAEQILVTEHERKRLTKGIPGDRRNLYSTGVQGIMQLFMDRKDKSVSFADIAAVSLLGVGLDEKTRQRFVANMKESGKYSKEDIAKLENLKLDSDTISYIERINNNTNLTQAQKSRLVSERLGKASGGLLTGMGILGNESSRKYGMEAVNEVLSNEDKTDDNSAFAVFLYGSGASNEHLSNLNDSEIKDVNKILTDSSIPAASRRKKLQEWLDRQERDEKTGEYVNEHVRKLQSSLKDGTLATTSEAVAATINMDDNVKSIATVINKFVGDVVSNNSIRVTVKREEA